MDKLQVLRLVLDFGNFELLPMYIYLYTERPIVCHADIGTFAETIEHCAVPDPQYTITIFSFDLVRL